MEGNVFPSPAVAGVLAKRYVEARLHTDGSTNQERILELQEKLARSIANPIYVVVDPKTEKELARFEGAALGAKDVTRFIAFLEQAGDPLSLLDR